MLVRMLALIYKQISDFGLAKIMPEGQETCVTGTVLGTFGYFDPEYTLVRLFLCFKEFLDGNTFFLD